MQAFDDMPQGGAPAAFAEHGVGVLLVHHDPEQEARADEQRYGEQPHEDGEISRDAVHQAGGDQEGDHDPNAVDDALHACGSKRERKAHVVPVGQQVAADHLSGTQRQHFIREESDIDCLHRAPETDARHGGQQGGPAPAMGDVDPEIGGHCQADPPVIQ